MQKTIKISNIQLLSDFAPALNEIKDIKMKGSLTVKVVKTMNNIFDVLRKYDTVRKSVLEKYAEKDANGKFITENKDGQQVYKFPSQQDQDNAGEAAMQIANEEIDLVVYPFKEEELDGIDGVTAETIGRLVKWGFVVGIQPEETKEIIREMSKEPLPVNN